MSGSKERSCECKELWGHWPERLNRVQIERDVFWGRWQWRHHWGDVYHAGVTMGLGRDQGTQELKCTPTAERWLQHS